MICQASKIEFGIATIRYMPQQIWEAKPCHSSDFNTYKLYTSFTKGVEPLEKVLAQRTSFIILFLSSKVVHMNCLGSFVYVVLAAGVAATVPQHHVHGAIHL